MGLREPGFDRLINEFHHSSAEVNNNDYSIKNLAPSEHKAQQTRILGENARKVWHRKNKKCAQQKMAKTIKSF